MSHTVYNTATVLGPNDRAPLTDYNRGYLDGAAWGRRTLLTELLEWLRAQGPEGEEQAKRLLERFGEPSR